MIISVGIDLVEIKDIIKSIQKCKRFINRVFTQREIEYCESKKNVYPHYSVRYAAKEALMKALGTGWDNGVQWKQIETIINVDQRQRSFRKPTNYSGKPEIELTGEALKRIKELGVGNIVVSLTHTQSFAMACVILEKE
jgi:holo-[acyl-carrier protein] synthase